MGNWQLEVFKMAIYIFMPVASFYVYHQVCWGISLLHSSQLINLSIKFQVDFFEDKLRGLQRRVHSTESTENEKVIKEAIEKIQKSRVGKTEKSFQEQLQELEKSS